MSSKIFLSALEYAKKKGISKMQVIRLIRQGSVPAQRVGNSWLIYADPTDSNQVGLTKTTSLQVWAKAIESQLHKTIDVERTKDREIIYAKMHSLGLPHERSFSFPIGKFPTKSEFKLTIERLGLPYWISAVPNPHLNYLNRQSKLRIYDLNSGYNFINKLEEKRQYKIIVTQYPENAEFKGTIIVSSRLNGIGEFVTGDRHYIMTRGFTLTDPMLFDRQKITKYSKTIPKSKQDEIYSLIRGIKGHFELQYGTLDNTKSITFFDYVDENKYIEIDQIYKILLNHHSPGLPAVTGAATGHAAIIHHQNADIYQSLNKGNILVSDTITPEMVPLLNKASAILTDLGGVTTHPAIVLRELKIPTIVGLVNITEKLKTGQKIKVDAAKGEIEIIS